jgi:p-aminobenzoyl-glutamate transporter AbgT
MLPNDSKWLTTPTMNTVSNTTAAANRSAGAMVLMPMGVYAYARYGQQPVVYLLCNTAARSARWRLLHNTGKISKLVSSIFQNAHKNGDSRHKNQPSCNPQKIRHSPILSFWPCGEFVANLILARIVRPNVGARHRFVQAKITIIHLCIHWLHSPHGGEGYGLTHSRRTRAPR